MSWDLLCDTAALQTHSELWAVRFVAAKQGRKLSGSTVWFRFSYWRRHVLDLSLSGGVTGGPKGGGNT